MSEFSQKAGLIYVDTRAGHRGAYLDLLAPLLGFEPLSGPLGVAVAKDLFSAPLLFIATFDDKVGQYCAIAVLRAVFNRPTVSLFLRPQSCFESIGFRSKVKWAVFRFVRNIPRLRLLTITPFSIAARYREVAHAWVWDPQYWDLLEGTDLRLPKETLLSLEIRKLAGDRKIICLPGFLTCNKGFDYLAEIIRSTSFILDRFLIVAAGPVQPDARGVAEVFSKAGGMLVDRLLEDAELESLYLVSDAMWTCYSPAYDQASGIFGRASQLDVPILVRRGSLIEKLALQFGMSFLALDYDSAADSGVALLRDFPARVVGKENLATRVGDAEAKRNDFLKTIRDSFATSRKN